MDSLPDPNRFSSPSSSQDFPTFVNYGRNFSPNQSAFISPSQRSDIVGQEFSRYDAKETQEVDTESPNLGHILAHDPYLMNSRISYPQPRLTSDENNLSLTSSSLIGSHNYLSQFGSRISNADHVSGPSQVQGTFQHHHRARRALQFGAPPYEELSNDMTSNSLCGLSQEDAYVSDSANLTTSSRLVSSNIATNSSMSQPANFVQTESTSPDVYWNSLEGVLVHDRNNDFANDSDFGSILAVDGENCPLPNNDHSPKIEDRNASSGSIDVAEPFSSPMQVTHVEHQMVPWNGGMPLPPDANGVEELNQVHSKRKRENAPNKDEKGKRCNCKNSKCLKLYCECFASGVYCVDSCGCQNCQNRPDYEDTVLVKRSEIESRNPLAFVPKVTYERAGSPTNTMEVETWTTPSSARHRRGCNCKNSKCSKKYCECYQGNVGCSINCRCHDCQNLFGRRCVWPLTELMHGRVVPSHGIMDLMGETEFNTSGNGIANQFPSLKGHYDSNHYAPSSQPSIIRSNSPNMPSLPWYPASQVQPLATSSPDSNHSPGGLSSPRLLENKASLDHYGSVQDFMVGIEIVPEETSPPSKAVQVGSPNQNHAPVPARFGADGLSSGASSPPVSTPDCKPMSTTVPSSSTFAAICPPANGVYQMGGDPKS